MVAEDIILTLGSTVIALVPEFGAMNRLYPAQKKPNGSRRVPISKPPFERANFNIENNISNLKEPKRWFPINPSMNYLKKEIDRIG